MMEKNSSGIAASEFMVAPTLLHFATSLARLHEEKPCTAQFSSHYSRNAILERLERDEPSAERYQLRLRLRCKLSVFAQCNNSADKVALIAKKTT